jgi:hypothetical protein
MLPSSSLTVPDVQVSRFRFFMEELRSRRCSDGQSAPPAEGEECREPAPEEPAPGIPPRRPLLPDPLDLIGVSPYLHPLALDETGDRIAFVSATGGLWVSEDQGERVRRQPDAARCGSHDTEARLSKMKARLVRSASSSIPWN